MSTQVGKSTINTMLEESLVSFTCIAADRGGYPSLTHKEQNLAEDLVKALRCLIRAATCESQSQMDAFLWETHEIAAAVINVLPHQYVAPPGSLEELLLKSLAAFKLDKTERPMAVVVSGVTSNTGDQARQFEKALRVRLRLVV